jgi:hypothetical protein
MAYGHWRSLGCACLLLCGLAFAPALAQESDPGNDHDCDDVPSERGEQGNDEFRDGYNCAQLTRNAQSLHTVSQAIRNVVARRLLGAPEGEAEPAGMMHSLPQARLEDGDLVVSPTADIAVVPETPVRRWNSWVDGKYSWAEAGPSDARTDGPLVNLTAGIDYKITDRFVVGVTGLFEDSDLETGGLFPTVTETQAWGAGVYFGLTIGSRWVLNGLVTASDVDTELDFVGILADIDSDRIQASGGLTGYYYFGSTRWSPSVTVAWSKEWQDDYVDSLAFDNPSQWIETGTVTWGQVLGHSFNTAGGMTLEPWIGAQLDWTFVNTLKIDEVGTFPSADSLDLRVLAGLNWTIAENVQLALSGEVSGLIAQDSDIYAGQANLAIQF